MVFFINLVLGFITGNIIYQLMFSKSFYSLFLLCFVVVACSVGLFFSVNSIQLFLMLISLLGLSVYIPVIIKQHYLYKKSQENSIKFASLHQGIEQFCEYAIFSVDGELIDTSHPHLYVSFDDFLQKTDKRFSMCPQWKKFKIWIEEFQMGDMLLRIPGYGGKEQLLLGRVIPQDQQHYEIKSILVCFEDISMPFEEYESINKEFKNLQKFIDYAPFAMFSADNKNKLTVFNHTFSQWLRRDQNIIVNSNVSEYIDGLDINKNIQLITVKPFRSPPFKALCFSSSNGILLLSRVDGLSIGSDNSLNSSEETFLKASIPAVIIDKDLNIISFNRACQNLFESAIATAVIAIGGKFFEFINQSSKQLLKEMLLGEVLSPLELILKDSKVHCISYISKIGQDHYLLQLMDISQQKKLEQQFIQSQKMQAIGQLAGGIAHDFNNLLTAMIGFCDLLLQRYMPNDPSYLDVSQIKQNANRAANLVRQLLAFSRQQTLQPRVVNVTDSLTELSSLLRRLIGAKIDLEVVHCDDIWPIKVDVSQFEQVVINLAVNARDAMLGSGKLTIKTSNLSNKSENHIGNEIMPIGDFVVIDVTDTGCGIPEENLEHIFEPFFSTKEVGAGTGLGLSTVYGIVKQTGGFIFVESEINKGTNFRICFPRHLGGEIKTVTSDVPKGDLSGSGTILLVEDEDAVRMFSARALREKGYKVLEASNGDDALNLVNKGAEFDVLLTDVVMPQMDGAELNNRLRNLIPNLKTIFISGYAEDTFRKNLGDDSNIHFLPKPFTLKDLAAKVKDVILQ